MQTNWQTKKLGEVCEIITGGTPKTSVKDFYGNEFLWAGPSDLDQGVFITNTNKKLSKKGFRESGIRLIPKNSVLLSCIGNIGKIGIAVEEMATNQQINTFVPNLKILDSKYLYYALIIKTEEFKFASSQTTLPIINKTKCSNIEIPLPTLPEQKKIAEVLDEKFAKLREAKQLQEQALVDTEKILSQTLNEIFEDGKKEGWEEVFLKDIAKYSIGLTYSPNDVSEQGTIVLRSSNVQNGALEFLDLVRVEKKIKEDLFVKDGDILMCSRNGSKRLIGKTAVIKNLPEKMTFGTFMTIIRSEYNPYLYYFFKSKLFFEQFSNGGGPMINQITKYMLDDIKLIVPPLAEQKKIVGQLNILSEKLDNLKELQKSQLEDFKKLEKAYLREAFNGELV